MLIDDDKKCNIHVAEIIDVESKNVDVETKSITFSEDKNNTIYAEMVDKNDDIHFVQEVTDHILWHEIRYKLCYRQYYKYYTYVRGIYSTPFVNPFGLWIFDDVILTLHDGLMQPYLTKNFSLLEQVTWTPSTEDGI